MEAMSSTGFNYLLNDTNLPQLTSESPVAEKPECRHDIQGDIFSVVPNYPCSVPEGVKWHSWFPDVALTLLSTLIFQHMKTTTHSSFRSINSALTQ